jgi:hypothetical protein
MGKKCCTDERCELEADDPATLWTTSNLAIAYEFQAKYKEAEALHVQCWKAWRNDLGPEDSGTMGALVGLSII